MDVPLIVTCSPHSPAQTQRSAGRSKWSSSFVLRWLDVLAVLADPGKPAGGGGFRLLVGDGGDDYPHFG
jgi:hypothetical protein